MRARFRAARWRGALLWSALAGPGCVAAQVGDISQVSYPGWVPADRVLPGYTVTASYNSAQALWSYGYTLSNGAGAQQALQSVRLRFNGPPLTVAQPSGWYDLTFPPPWRCRGRSSAPGCPTSTPAPRPRSPARRGFSPGSPWADSPSPEESRIEPPALVA